MAITKFSRNYHEKMFPKYHSAFLETDPEFIERFDNFAFDEVVNSDDLDDKTRFIAILASLLGCQGVDEFSVMLGAAMNFGVTPVEIREIVYQATAYLGIGRVFPFLKVMNKVFTEKGIKDTSIQEIVDNASVAKGTFYLYFKDKYEIRDILIAKKSQKLFSDALKSLRKNYISDFSDCIIYIINYVIDELTKNPLLLKFISKNLSWGVFSKTVLNLHDKGAVDEDSVYDLFIRGIEENNIKLSNPDVTLFMIIELVGSTCFNSILYKEPLPIEDYKPYLYRTIRNLIKDEEIKK